LESLEDRWVPADNSWLGYTADATDGANWTANHAPMSHENIYIFANQSDYSNSDCDLSEIGVGEFASLTIANDYAYTVTLPDNFTLGGLNFFSGTLNQGVDDYEEGPELTIELGMGWYGGTLNDTDYLGIVHFLGGSGTVIDSEGVITGSTLSFECEEETGSNLTVEAGTEVEFTNYAGAIIGGYCTAVVNLGTAILPATVAFKAVQGIGGGGPEPRLTLRPGSTMTVTGPGTFTCELPIYNYGGVVHVKTDATASIKKSLVVTSGTGPSYLQETSTAKTIIDHGSRLKVEFGYSQTNGILGSDSPSTTQDAVLDGNVVIAGGIIDPNYLGTQGTSFAGSAIRITGYLSWNSGELWIDVNGSVAGVCDKLKIDGGLTVGSGAAIRAIIIEPPTGGIGGSQSWSFLTATGGVPTTHPPITMVNGGSTQFTISAFGSPIDEWRFNS